MEILSDTIFNTWQFWVVTAVVLFIVEIFTPGFFIATFGIGALCTVVAALITDNLNIQLLVFAVSTTLTYVYIRPLAKKYFFKKQPETATNVDALVGKKAKVIETIDPINSKGRIKLIGGEDWKALSNDESIIEKDAIVEITAVDGAKVIVKKIQE
mgnify:CR=1 FL=1